MGEDEAERLAEQLRRERDLHDRLVSFLAHDLRGPLLAARIGVERLAARSREPIGPSCGRILRCLDRAERMVRDMLDAHRLRIGEQLQLALAPCDLAAIARELVEELEEEHPGRVSLAVEGAARGVWSGEELRRCLWNLAENAVKYGSDSEAVRIAIRPRGAELVIAVHNGGEPIPPEELPRIFEPDRRCATADARSWGLGLALVKWAIEAHGGTVGVESSRAAGTTFELRLPWDARSLRARARERSADG
jgi:signal transduction histidine kinase